ncbi:MAG: slipin family protein, partial [Gammaproteobacteria bacterium]|nr:slipin family protein [Gammaproteobacteria bacterium]
LRYLQTLTEIAGEKSSTIVFPLPVNLIETMNRLLGGQDGNDGGGAEAASS